MNKYRNPALKKLSDQQMKYANRETKLAQITNAEELVHDLKLEKSYRYGEIFERITHHKSELYPHLSLKGDEVIHDVRCLIEDLSDSIDLRADSLPEEVLTVNDLTEQLNVSAKTVDRWRDKGLVSRRLIVGKRKRIGFLRSSVDRFLADHSDEVSHGTRFSQMSSAETETLVHRARVLVQDGANATEVCQQLSDEMNRSAESIRYTMIEFDRRYPEQAIFPESKAPLSHEDSLEIYHRFRRRVPASQLAKEYKRTTSSIYRVIQEVRARKILDVDLSFIDSPEFYEEDAETTALGEAPPYENAHGHARVPPGLPSYLASLYDVPLLSREQEAYYFRKMNFLKYHAGILRQKLSITQPALKLMDQIEQMIEQAIEVKNFLIRSNLRLVVSIAKKHMKANTNFFEMVSDGNMSLIKAIEKFDYTKGNKFSTYATWAVMKNYARSIPQEAKIQDRFRTGNEEVFLFSEEERGNQFAEEIRHHQQHDALMDILQQLDPREREILVRRFGLDEKTEPLTLEQVGEYLGVTKERIRQLESRALRKLKQIAQREKLDIPGVDM
jgi:RNA polymerase sigma factor (sigma-70 family)